MRVGLALTTLLASSSKMDRPFPFVQDSQILEAPSQRPASSSSSNSRFTLTETLNIADNDPKQDSVDLESVVELARQAYAALYGDHPENKRRALFDPAVTRLLHFSQTSSTTVALLLALNQLESTIRNVVVPSGRGAPLLTVMLRELQDPVLDALLLPSGLNLRNLVWHGFVGEHPECLQPWLALVLIKIQNLQQQQPFNEKGADKLAPPLVYNYKAFDEALARGRKLRETQLYIDSPLYCLIKEQLVPSSHQNLLHFCFTNRSQPTIVATVLVILLEHALRLLWCRVNDKPKDASARQGHFYVTLDGHGQKHQHDVILFPYCIDERQNKLVEQLGGTTMALLIDLFISAKGGPNVRAALAHGAYDEHIRKELLQPAPGRDENWEVVDVLLTTTQLVAKQRDDSTFRYRPKFTFTASVIRSILAMRSNRNKLKDLRASLVIKAADARPKDFGLDDRVTRSLSLLSFTMNDKEWTTKNVFCEHDLNQRLEPLAAARSLFDEIASATQSFCLLFDDALTKLSNSDNLSKREQKKLHRILSSSGPVLEFYSFAGLVATINLNQALGDEIELTIADSLSAVERTRMVVSTVATFVIANAERAFKAVDDYWKGKAVKKVRAIVDD